MTTGEPRWTIAELGARVSAALADTEYQPPSNGQVRAVPDLRTIRYYTTIGLLDRPAAMRGRTALYGPRHLLQLVAVKRLQAEGRSLSEVQAELTGLDDRGLAAIARVSAARAAEATAASPVTADMATADADAAEQAPREARFWAAAPAPALALAAAAAASPPVPAGTARAARIAPAAAPIPAIAAMAKIELGPGVSLMIE
ncbi:MAG TPA: MerR family transcriptional regulator, partial [Kofleriaceae bacterium]|nr:MerR family transcriptional regulator [Kofleriaceae bacterium]